MNAKIKVLLASRPKLLSEVIRYLVASQADMEVMGEVLNPIELLLAVKATGAGGSSSRRLKQTGTRIYASNCWRSIRI